MSAHYDTCNYPAYWEGRDYEQKCEALAISNFLKKIEEYKNVLEIGAGYGRMVPTYLHRARKVLLSEPSAKLLAVARKKYLNSKKVFFLQSTVENLPHKISSRSISLAVMIRVLHHIDDPEKVFSVVHKLLDTNGYFILEFANKLHFKSMLREFIHGNFTYPLEIELKDARTAKTKRNNTIHFNNFHPEAIIKSLKDFGFEIIEIRSVSNIRNEFLKSNIPVEVLIFFEKYFQLLLSRFYFGPSIFVLAKKH